MLIETISIIVARSIVGIVILLMSLFLIFIRRNI
jgi:hypothetical protein